MGTGGANNKPFARTRQGRHDEVLGRWPVLNERWALSIEASRTVVRTPGPPSDGIDPLTAINRKMGLPDDHGRDAVQRAREKR